MHHREKTPRLWPLCTPERNPSFLLYLEHGAGRGIFASGPGLAHEANEGWPACPAARLCYLFPSMDVTASFVTPAAWQRGGTRDPRTRPDAMAVWWRRASPLFVWQWPAEDSGEPGRRWPGPSSYAMLRFPRTAAAETPYHGRPARWATKSWWHAEDRPQRARLDPGEADSWALDPSSSGASADVRNQTSPCGATQLYSTCASSKLNRIIGLRRRTIARSDDGRIHSWGAAH